MPNVPAETIVIPQPSREPVAALRESFNLDDLLDEDGCLILPEEQKDDE